VILHSIDIAPTRIYWNDRAVEMGGFWRNVHWFIEGRCVDGGMRDFIGFNQIPWC
jgi:hypothetical protein